MYSTVWLTWIPFLLANVLNKTHFSNIHVCYAKPFKIKSLPNCHIYLRLRQILIQVLIVDGSLFVNLMTSRRLSKWDNTKHLGRRSSAGDLPMPTRLNTLFDHTLVATSVVEVSYITAKPWLTSTTVLGKSVWEMPNTCNWSTAGYPYPGCRPEEWNDWYLKIFTLCAILRTFLRLR